MTDKGRELKGPSTEDIHARAHVDDLLTAAVRFSNARRAYLLTPSRDTFVVHTKIILEDEGVIATYPRASQLDPYEAAILDQVALSQERMQAGAANQAPDNVDRGKSGDLPSMCIPILGPSKSTCLIYMEAGLQEPGFPEHVVKAIELYAVALGRVFHERVYHSGLNVCLSQSSDRGQPDEQRDLDGVDPVVLASVAESIAIEVNDALSAVIAHAGAGLQWLNQDSPKVEKARQSFRKVASSTFSVGSIVAAYRKALRPGSADNEPADLQAIVTDALEALTTDLRAADILCRCDLSSSMLVQADAKQVQQAIVNVVSIAVEAMKAAEARILTISGTVEDRFCTLAFSDTGETIPVDARDAIFDPYYTAKQGSRGIKLAIARTIAQLHGGTLDIARSSTNGTTMLLKLPLMAAHS